MTRIEGEENWHSLLLIESRLGPFSILHLSLHQLDLETYHLSIQRSFQNYLL
jgi:hypothetical protein